MSNPQKVSTPPRGGAAHPSFASSGAHGLLLPQRAPVPEMGGPSSFAEHDARHASPPRSASPPLVSGTSAAYERPLPSPPRPPRASEHRRMTGDENGDEGAPTSLEDGSLPSTTALNAPEHTNIPDTPQYRAPLYLASTTRGRSAQDAAAAAVAEEEEEAARREAQGGVLSPSPMAAIAEPETPLGMTALVLDNSSGTSTLLSPSPKAEASTSGSTTYAAGGHLSPEGGAHAEGGAGPRWKRGGSRDFYAEEAVDVATLYKNAGLVPPDLDELEDEALLGRSFTPALFNAKQRERSHHPSPHEGTPVHGPAVSPPRPTPPPPPTTQGLEWHNVRDPFAAGTMPHFAAHSTTGTTGTIGSAGTQARAAPRTAATHPLHYPHAHGVQMPVFVGGSGGSGGSGGALVRHTSAVHSTSGSQQDQDMRGHSAAAPETGGQGGSDRADGWGDRAGKPSRHDRPHKRRHRHRSPEAGGAEESKKTRTGQSHTHTHKHHHRRRHRRHRSDEAAATRAHPASATLPAARGRFPYHEGDTTAMGGAHFGGDVPDSPILPEPAVRQAQSASQPNERAHHFPRYFGYLASTDDETAETHPTLDSSPTGTGSETTYTRTSASVTPHQSPTTATAATDTAGDVQPVDMRDVVYSLVPSTRASSVTPSPVPERRRASGSADFPPADASQTLPPAPGSAPGSLPVGSAGLPRASTAPSLAQEETQRQLQEALHALGMYMRPSEPPSLAQSQRGYQPAPLTADTIEEKVRMTGLLRATLAGPTTATTSTTTTAPRVSAHPLAPSSHSHGDPATTAAMTAQRPALPEGTLSTPVAPQSPQNEFPTGLAASTARMGTSPGPLTRPSVREGGLSATATSALMGANMPCFEPQGSPAPLNQRRSYTVPAVDALQVPASGFTTSSYGSPQAAAGATPADSLPSLAHRGTLGGLSQPNSFGQSMSFNPVRNASFLLNASFGQLANFSFVKDGSVSNSRLTQQNRDALVKELESRRARLVKQLAQQQKDATMGNVFALVRGSNAWQLQYLLQEGLVDVNERDYNSCTPLHVAALEGNQAIARLLLSFGADVLAVDRFGRTPLDCAAVNRHGSVGRYLLAVIRTKQQQQMGHADSVIGGLDASSMAVAAAVEGEESVPPTPFGLSAPTGHGQDGLVSSNSPSTAPGTAAATMTHSVATTGPRTFGGFDSSHTAPEEDGLPRLLVPGAELVGRKQEKTLRNRARREGGPDSPEPASQSAHSGHGASGTGVEAPMTTRADGEDNTSHPKLPAITTTAGAAARGAADGLCTPGSGPTTPWVTVATAQPGTPLLHSAAASAPTATGKTRDKAQPQTESVSRGRSRRARPSQHAALFAAEEDKFLEEQEEQIAEEVALSAVGPMGSPTFYRPTAAMPTSVSSAAMAASTSTASVSAATTAVPDATSSEKGGATVTSTDAEANDVTAAGASTDAAAVPGDGEAKPEPAAEGQVACMPTDEDGGGAPRFSIFTTISDTVSLIVCMCGLPGRGKSFISKRLVRYINWKGVPCRVFNAGNYRRQLLGVAGTADAAFFDPNNPKGKESRERMAELACEDLVRFISSHVLAVGILDATNTTKARRTRLKHFFENECQKYGLPYRLLFIESVCTDETIITENILRSKCDNDDFKDVQDTTEVIAEFRDRIHQYEKVYETLEPSEDLPFIKIINVKHHVIIHKVESGLGSRIAFFLQNLHPVAYPIYVVMAGQTFGDQQGVFGGDERLTEKGEEFALALRQFIQDRYVPNMVVLHATNPSVLSTIRPLMEGTGGGGAHGHGSHNNGGNPTATAASPMAMSGTGRSDSGTVDAAGNAKSAGDIAAVATTTGGGMAHSAGAKSANSPTTSLGSRRHSHQSSPASRGGSHYVFPTELPPRKLHQAGTSPAALARLAGGDVRAIAIHDDADNDEESDSSSYSSSYTSSYTSSSSSSPRAAAEADGRDGNASSSAYSGESGRSTGSQCGGSSSSDDEDAEEVLCPVPGLDNINFGRFSGHSAGWVREKYPRLSALLYVSALEDEARNASHAKTSPVNGTPTSTAAGGGGSSTSAGSPIERTASAHVSSPTIPPPISGKLKEGGLGWFKHAPSHLDPLLAYCVQFPNGESCRQVNARLEPALMAVMRTQSPVFVVAPAVPAQGMLAFFADVIPELSPTLRVPRHCVIELGVKDDVTVHPLVPGAGIPGMNQIGSPLMDDHEIQEALKLATGLATAATTVAEASP